MVEFNSNIRPARRRTVAQSKTHYTKTNKLVVHFNGCWIRIQRAHGSGESDDKIIAKAHAIYKTKTQGRPFTLEYWWKAVKDQPKWAKRSENQEILTNKRLKHNESGAYTSSLNQESEDAEPNERPRPEGQKKAKVRLKGKEKKLTSELSLESLKAKKMKLYHEATKRRAEAIEKVADARNVKPNLSC